MADCCPPSPDAGETLRQLIARRRRTRTRLLIGALACAASVPLAAATLWTMPALFVWNASPSAPLGLYRIQADASVRRGDMVVAWAPPFARRMAAARSYLPLRVPLVKRVAAVAGDRVCARQGRIFINGRQVALRQRHDPSGRLMPWWSGCTRLEQGDTFLLSQAGPLAFDGRYFGVTRPAELLGRARLLWAKPRRGSDHG